MEEYKLVLLLCYCGLSWLSNIGNVVITRNQKSWLLLGRGKIRSSYICVGISSEPNSEEKLEMDLAARGSMQRERERERETVILRDKDGSRKLRLRTSMLVVLGEMGTLSAQEEWSSAEIQLEARNRVLIATNCYRERRATTRSCEQRPVSMYLNMFLCIN